MLKPYDENMWHGMYLDSMPAFSRNPKYIVDHVDVSPAYETDEAFLLQLENGTYALVELYGCSCYTDQKVYEAQDIRSLLHPHRNEYGAMKTMHDKWHEKGFRLREWHSQLR
jgi:hypothetical protein